MRHHKLVRDHIPDLIRAKGEAVVTHVADEAEYWQKLKEKLREEAEEFIKDETAEELADLLEVINAIIVTKHFRLEDIQALQAKKAQERGGFFGRVILDES